MRSPVGRTEEIFLALAEIAPAGLAALIADAARSGRLDDSELTLAAEAMGIACDVPLIHQTLVPLLSHRSAIVREGALYGLCENGAEGVREAVRAVALDDKHPGVRRAAQLLLDGADRISWKDSP